MKPLRTIVLHEIKRLYKSFLLFGSLAAVAATLIPSFLILLPLQDRQRASFHRNALDLRSQLEGMRSVAGLNLGVETPPPPLSFVNRGLLDEVDSRVEFSRLNPSTLRPLAGQAAVIGYFFPSTDVVTLSGWLFSLIPFAFGCSAISGEKERGTLRAAWSSPVSRGQYLAGKMLGDLLGLIAPWLMLTLLSAIAIGASPSLRSAMRSSDWIVFGCVFLLVYLYAAVHLQVAFLVSALTRRTVDTMLALLFIWLFTQVVAPSVALEVAQSWAPAPGSGEIRHQLAEIETAQVLSYAKVLERAMGMSEGGLSQLAASRPAREYFHYPRVGAFITRSGDFWMNASEPSVSRRLMVELPELMRRQNELRSLRGEIYRHRLRIMLSQLTIARWVWAISPAAILREITADLAGTGPESVLDLSRGVAEQAADFFARLESSNLFRENFGRRIVPNSPLLTSLAGGIDGLDVAAGRSFANWSRVPKATGYLLFLWVMGFVVCYVATVRYDPR